jgi:uncharacterized protein (DUF433 family)
MWKSRAHAIFTSLGHTALPALGQVQFNHSTFNGTGLSLQMSGDAFGVLSCEDQPSAAFSIRIVCIEKKWHPAIADPGYNGYMIPITTDPEIMNGAPCFRGTRVPVKNLFDSLARGRSLDYFLSQFPSVTREQAVEVLELATEKLLHEVPAT